MDEKVVRFPIEPRFEGRDPSDFAVRCEVSERWLQFDPVSADLRGGEFIGLTVMTRSNEGAPRKLCQMYVTRENLISALQRVRPQ